MNNPLQGAPLTVQSREQIVAPVLSGQTAAEVAAAFAVSIRTVRKWLARFRAVFAGGGGGGHPSPAPDPAAYRGGDRARRWGWRAPPSRAGCGARGLAGLRRSTRPRRCAGIGATHRANRSTSTSRSWAGQASPATASPWRRSGCRNRGKGWLEPWSATGPRTMARVHVAVDDATRLSCAEVLAEARKATTAAFLMRALRRFRARGVRARRVLTDKGSACRSRRFAKALRRLAIRHIFTRPCTPRTNGKTERFIQTLMREWACGLAHPSSAARDADLPCWLDWFNRSRPHAARNGLSPRDTVNNLVRTHS
jgi:transposase InsO family protein